VVDLQFIKRW